MGVSSIPPGGCQLLYEEGVAQTWSLPILAWGAGMKTMGGALCCAVVCRSVWWHAVLCLRQDGRWVRWEC